MKRWVFIFLTLLVASPSFSKNSIPWKELLPGLHQASWTGKDSQGNPLTLELYKIDPKLFRFEVVQAKDLGKEKITAEEIVRKKGAVLGVNGGFFDSQYQSLGLIVKDGKVLNPVRPISWWGVFWIDKASGPQMSRAQEFQAKTSVEMAIQAGPRLVDGGKPLPLKKNDSRKTFIGMTSDNEIVLGTTDLSSVDAGDLAQILRKELKLKKALNLDGGSSTQLYAKIGSFEKEIPGFGGVANGIVVVPRK